ncbi:hypothetical protein U27_03594 [Candidatus Vecturithrix granuli]|uniref:Uncharacterized protein n=1 Tax=Vecturithrix granuli TaxID=1499967 RepID=A0A081BWC6_VECG1|nr:hypothetical protein U27_03594 [Candidatus Vecturithrix granuli]
MLHFDVVTFPHHKHITSSPYALESIAPALQDVLVLCQHLSDWFVVNALAFKRRLSGYYEPVGQTLTKH